MPRFTMLIGLPGSGKSTMARRMAKERDAVICSSDEMRRRLFGDENVQGNPKAVFARLNAETVKKLTAGKDVIYDATNVTYADRHEILEKVNALKSEMTDRGSMLSVEGIVMGTPLPVCLEQNQERDRQVPDEAIFRMRNRFEMPVEEEGFDLLEIHYPKEEYRTFHGRAEDLAGALMDYDQQNPYHTETLGEHLLMMHKETADRTEDLTLREAALLHDCGKMETRTVRDGVAHYYSHEHVGAYESMFYFGEADPVKRGWLITYHMSPYRWKDGNSREVKEFEKRFGSRLTEEILLFHEADDAARRVQI